MKTLRWWSRIAVDVEQARVERATELLDELGVPPLGDVGDGEEDGGLPSQRLEHVPPGVEHAPAVHVERRVEHDRVEVDRAP